MQENGKTLLRLLSLGPVLLCQRARLQSNIFYLDYGGLRMDRIMEVASVHKVCWTPWNLVRVHLGLVNICLHLESTPESGLEVETGGGRTFSFPGMMQENSKTLLRPTPLKQPTGPLQPCFRALLVSASPLLVSARPLLVSAPSMPDVRRFLSLGPVLLCQRAKLPSIIFYLDYGGLRMDRIMEVASEHKVCWTPWNLVRVQVGLANICLHLKSTRARRSCLEVQTVSYTHLTLPTTPYV